MSLRKFALALSLLFSLVIVAPLAADPPAKEGDKPAEVTKQRKAKGTQFVRVQTDKDDEAVSMETAIVSYVGENADGKRVQVDLIGAIHIGDRAYYQQLNKEFESYQSLLYELVAPKGARPERGAAGIYSPVANMLDLADQISVIDYNKKNFVHADMSWEEMSESMKNRQESFTNMVFRAVGQSIAQQSTKKGASDGDLLAALLFAKKPAVGLKKVLARQFSDMEDSMSWLEGPNGSTLITERNKAALAVLKSELASGKTKIGIFYGAGHFPDMEKRLVEDFKLKQDGQKWLVCWDLSEDAAGNKAPNKPPRRK